MQIIRSLLFVPGNRAKMLDKATGLKPDAVVPDMEDSVPTGEKQNARRLIASYLPTLAESGHRIIPRVNALNTGLMEEDLRAVIGPYVYGVSIGKIDNAADLRRVADTIGRMEIDAGVPFGSVAVVPWVETASAIVHAHTICTASKRVAAIAFGGEDLTNDMGIQRTKSEREVEYPRRVAAVAARAARVLALDTPYFDYMDTDGLRQNSIESRNLGFQGRFAIHPSQIEAINAAKRDGDTLGGVVEARVGGVPFGLGSHVQWDRKLSGRIGQALLSMNAFKGVEIGDGFAGAARRGASFHDVVLPQDAWSERPWRRQTNDAGGIEGGISNG